MSLNKIIKSFWLIFTLTLISCNTQVSIGLPELVGISTSAQLLKYENDEICTDSIYYNFNVEDSIFLLFTPSMCSGCKQSLVDILNDKYIDNVNDISILVLEIQRIRDLHFYELKDHEIFILKNTISKNKYNSDYRPILVKVNDNLTVLSILYFDKHLNYSDNIELLNNFFKHK